MANQEEDPNPETTEPRIRLAGGTEYSWCRAVPGGTGITVLALYLSKPPDISLLQTALHKIQNSHSILRSKLHFEAATNTFSFITQPSSSLQIHQFDLLSTSEILQAATTTTINPPHSILEHEINNNAWADVSIDTEVFHVSLYTLSDTQWAVALRLHTGACDRTAAVALLRELLAVMMAGGGDVIEREYEKEVEGSLGIEDLIPRGKANKPFWARGLDMLGYSLNSFRLSHLDFVDTDSPRCSQVVRLKMSQTHTDLLLAGCKSRGIKLCGALAAAGLIAAHASKNLPDYQAEKYAVVTLIDCRSTLDPVLSGHHAGFYHSAILNTHDILGDETLWDLARRCYESFSNAKNSNKHFTDMSDLNFLMCKAIENPGLTPSSSLRTAFISVFEDAVIEQSNRMHQFGVEDYIGCASVHGVGPTLAIFDTIRNGQLDSACVYPSPLHSREQMQSLVDDMVKILVDGCSDMDSDKTVG